MKSLRLLIVLCACGGSEPMPDPCPCDTTYACTTGCACDPECTSGSDAGHTSPIGADCNACSEPGVEYCSDSTCSTQYCLWDDGAEDYCSQRCESTACPAGYTCTTLIPGQDEWCIKDRTVPNCGTCTHSSECMPFLDANGFYISAACFDGRCRMRCRPDAGACACQAGTPTGGDAVGFCTDDGC